MIAIKFPDANVVYAKDQPEYNSLPALKFEDGDVVTCWTGTIKERLRFLFLGKLWLGLKTFNKPLTPLFLTTKKSDLITYAEQDSSTTTQEG